MIKVTVEVERVGGLIHIEVMQAMPVLNPSQANVTETAQKAVEQVNAALQARGVE